MNLTNQTTIYVSGQYRLVVTTEPRGDKCRVLIQSKYLRAKDPSKLRTILDTQLNEMEMTRFHQAINQGLVHLVVHAVQNNVDLTATEE